MLESLKNCRLCPRNCGVNRLEGELGFCRAGLQVRIAKVCLHEWEEPCISGTKGSGTVFFSNCNLRCVFCQNHSISEGGCGKDVSIERLAEIFLEQQDRGAHNINLVTPTHYVPQIIEAVTMAKQKGLILPILYNTNSYENAETIRSLDGIVDVYLADLKYHSDAYALKYSGAKDYFIHASKAIDEMFGQVGAPVFDSNSIMQRGLIARHLMLPGLLFDTKKVMDYLLETFGDDIYVSIMNQYTPMHKASLFPEIDKRLNKRHYESIIQYCLDSGMHNAFIQDPGTATVDYVPDFDLSGI